MPADPWTVVLVEGAKEQKHSCYNLGSSGCKKHISDFSKTVNHVHVHHFHTQPRVLFVLLAIQILVEFVLQVDICLQFHSEESTMASGRKGTAKLNEILDIEQRVQEKWTKARVFEKDAPKPGEPRYEGRIS